MAGAGERRAAVFLDRDGVLNQAIVRDGRPFAPRSLSELTVLPEAPPACRSLRNEGFLIIVVTNQPELSRGSLDAGTLEALHAALGRRVALDGIYVCPHDDRQRCACRKPAPGLLLQAAAENDIDLGRSFLVGDRWRDIEAGQRAGCRTIFIDRGYLERRSVGADAEVSDLAEAAERIRMFKEGSPPG
ncbi:MAG: HAD family hydrolase [Acidimicrobiaceae bacterium]|nr:HAD family hydrolase [Acidimicrobiaceae bacterium]MBO0886774.1 HAD family hydrolase [Acidimicrobiales bacterium]